MKRLKLILVLILSVSLTGCIQEYKATDEQSDAAAEYMAGLLLKNDKNYDQDLLPREELSISDSKDNKVSTVENINSPDTSPELSIDTAAETTDDNSTLTQVLGVTNFDIQYEGYSLVDIYPKNPENAGFSLTPREGYQLLVVTFKVENKSDTEQELNLIDKEIVYQLDINNTVYKPLFTVFQNDLRYLDITIGKRKSEDVILTYEVSKDTEISNVILTVSYDSKSEVINMK